MEILLLEEQEVQLQDEKLVAVHVDSLGPKMEVYLHTIDKE